MLGVMHQSTADNHLRHFAEVTSQITNCSAPQSLINDPIWDILCKSRRMYSTGRSHRNSACFSFIFGYPHGLLTLTAQATIDAWLTAFSRSSQAYSWSLWYWMYPSTSLSDPCGDGCRVRQSFHWSALRHQTEYIKLRKQLPKSGDIWRTRSRTSGTAPLDIEQAFTVCTAFFMMFSIAVTVFLA